LLPDAPQVPDNVVTFIGALFAPVPAPSIAATAKLNVVDGVKPDTWNVVPLVPPIKTPFLKTL
jgi:hypothetical protein